MSLLAGVSRDHSDAGSAPNRDADQLVAVPLEDLIVGVRLRFPVRDERNTLLLASGLMLTSAILDKLKHRGLNTVHIHTSEVTRLTSEPVPKRGGTGRPAAEPPIAQPDRVPPATRAYGSAPQADPIPTARPVAPQRPRFESASHQIVAPPVASLGAVKCPGKLLAKLPRHGATSHDPKAVEAVARNYQANLRGIVGLYESGKQIRAGEITMLQGMSEECLGHIMADVDVFVCQSGIPEIDKYPPRHGQQTAMLAIAMGLNLGLEKKDLIDLATACLVHDLGMLYLDGGHYNHERALKPASRLEITKHPGITYDLLANVDQIASTARLIAFQMHERCNGSGYPRGRTDGQIHPLAKIAAVADCYLAMISPRPHRPALTRYAAIEQLLHATRQGLYDPIAVRALLRTVSLFPLGSQVELSDGRVASVLRSCGDHYTTPIVEARRPNAPNQKPEILDLGDPASPRVVRAI